MKTLISFILFLICLNLHAQQENLLVQQVKAKLDKVKDYQATGNMKINVSFINTAPSQVMVYYKQPNKFKVVKAGGISILPKGGVSVNINSILVDEHYTVVAGGKAILDGTPVTVVKLLPLDEHATVVITTLYIDEKQSLIKKSIVTTRESGTYEMTLRYGKYASWGLPDEVVFSFDTKEYKLPKGLTIEYEKGNDKKPDAPKSTKGVVTINYSNYQINKGIDDKIFAK